MYTCCKQPDVQATEPKQRQGNEYLYRRRIVEETTGRTVLVRGIAVLKRRRMERLIRSRKGSSIWRYVGCRRESPRRKPSL